MGLADVDAASRRHAPQSDPFGIKGDKIDFLMGGGGLQHQTCIDLFVATEPMPSGKPELRPGTETSSWSVIRGAAWW